jgi:hypothetical protein
MSSELRSTMMRRGGNRINDDSPNATGSSSLPKTEVSLPVFVARRGNGSNEELPSLPTSAELPSGSPKPRAKRSSGPVSPPAISPPVSRRENRRSITIHESDSGEEDSAKRE